MDLSFLKSVVRGSISEDAQVLDSHSTDASLFKVVPAAVFTPEDADDLSEAVKAVAAEAKAGKKVSLTARAAGTCMSGGSLTDSIQVDCSHLSHINYEGGNTVSAEPGAYFRDVERTVVGSGYFYPSYPASKMLCAIGGMVANNAGGEKNLRYGKTNKYVQSLDVVLDDGSQVTLRKLDETELAEKVSLENREGEIYRAMYDLIIKNQGTIQEGRPQVTKNSSGYNLWDVYDAKNKTFDLTQLFVGSQGTLALFTSATLKLEKPMPYSNLTVLFLKNERHIATLVKDLLGFKPESIESFDKHTMSLAIRFLPVLAKHIGAGMIMLGLRFIPEAIHTLLHGMPELTILVELTSDNEAELAARVAKLHEFLKTENVDFKAAGSTGEANKWWAVRRESFSLLREHTKDRQTAPFIDDLIVKEEDLTEFMPQLEKLIAGYEHLMTYTIAGHVGDGNFHVIPLMNLHDPEARAAMYELQDKAVALTLSFGGSTSGEHNDGMIRTHYVEKQFGAELFSLFEKTKDIFDPNNIFNPGKKVHGDWEFAQKHVK